MANNQFFPQTNTKALIVGAVGGFFVVALLFIIYLGCNLFNYQLVLQPKYISQEKIIYLDANDSICAELDSIHRAHYIDSLKNARIVLSPQEYTSNVVDYYNIAFIVMSAMLVIFTALSFIHFRTSIKEAFQKMLDSKDFQKDVAETLSGRIEEFYGDWLYARELQFEDFSRKIQNLKSNLSKLEEQVRNLEDGGTEVIVDEPEEEDSDAENMTPDSIIPEAGGTTSETGSTTAGGTTSEAGSTTADGTTSETGSTTADGITSEVKKKMPGNTVSKTDKNEA